MPRRSRLVLPSTPLHIIQRGNNRSPCFFAHSDRLVYLDFLSQCSQQADCDVHAYVLMTNHVHLLISPKDADSPAELMQRLGQRYVQYVNRHYARTGTLWEGRFRSCLVGDERYLLICQRYIELNPVRAGIVNEPEKYPWSSYGINALGRQSQLIQPHLAYLALGRRDEERQTAYRAMFREALPDSMLERIRFASNANFAFGSNEFAKAAAQALGRSVMPGSAGRPRNRAENNCAKNLL
jgi:putative transposase